MKAIENITSVIVDSNDTTIGRAGVFADFLGAS